MLRRLVVGLFLSVFALGCQADLPDFTEIVEEATPAVVKILVEYESKKPQMTQEYDELPEYLKRFFEFRGQPPMPEDRGGMGSGFIISEDGYIVTNHHVVDNAARVLIRMTDRREFEGSVVGVDPRSDLALIKIDAQGLPTLRLAEDALTVGQWVLAIGSPFGLDFSVTAGIVSAMGRSLPTEQGENYVPFIQTDVAINPGNSGGPLFNLEGDVVGVNSQIFTRSGGSIGLSFAIPSSVVNNVVAQLKAEGVVVRGWLGVAIQDVDSNLAEAFGLDRPKGALVAQVVDYSPAAAAGLEAGDVIVQFAGEAIVTSSDLPHVVGLLSPDSDAIAIVIREGETLEIPVVVGALNRDEQPRQLAGASPTEAHDPLGLTVGEIDPATSKTLGLAGAVEVLAVQPDSVAAEAGILAGDLITRIGKTILTRVSDYSNAVSELTPGQSVQVRLIRNGSPRFLGVKIPQTE